MGGYNPANGLLGLQGAVNQAAPTATGQGLAAQNATIGNYLSYGYVYYTTAGTTNTPVNFAPGAFVEVAHPNQTTNIAYQQQWVQWNREYTEEQLAVLARLRFEHQAQQEGYRREFERQQVEANTASARAKELLLSCLSPAQRATYEQRLQFIVRCPSGNLYALSYSHPPMRLDRDNEADTSYCIHTSGIPREDELLGFKLMLEANEQLFLSTANATRLRPPRARIAA